MLSKISSMLDAVADSLEAKGLIKEAFEIDKIADEFDSISKNHLNPKSEKGYVFSSYWKTWNRLLGKTYNGSYAEINLTPINAHRLDEWSPYQKTQIEPIIIRLHGTGIGRIEKELPKNIENNMVENIGPDLTNRLLTENFASKIDWDLLASTMRGGGVPLNSVLKKS
jgi:hypothetical protein